MKFLTPLIDSIPGGGYRTFIISLLLVIVGLGIGFTAISDTLPADIATPIAITTILVGLQGLFGRAATVNLEKQLEAALIFIIDTQHNRESATTKEPEPPNTKPSNTKIDKV